MKKLIAIILSLAMIVTVTPAMPKVAKAAGVPVTSVQVEGTHEIGQTLTAVPGGAGGATPTNVTYQWWISYEEYDSLSDDYETYEQKVQGGTEKTFFIPDYIYYDGKLGESATNCKIWVEVKGDENSSKKSPAKSIARGSNVDQAKDAAAVDLPKKLISNNPLTLPTSGAKGSSISWQSSHPAIITTSGLVTMPEEETVVTLTGTFTKNGSSITRVYNITVAAASQAVNPEDQARVDAAKAELEKSLRYKAKYGTDQKAVDVIKRQLASKGINDVDVELVSVKEGDESKVDAQGNIIYVKKDLDDVNNTIGPMDKWKQAQINIKLKKGNYSQELRTKINIYWDLEFLKAELKRALFDKITPDMIKGDNESLDNVTSKIVLPSYIKYDGSDKYKLYAEFKWAVSDESAGGIEEKGNGYPIGSKTYEFTPNPGATDKTVNLVGTIEFRFTNDYDAPEEDQMVASLKKEIPITIKGTGPQETEEEKMARYLDEYVDLNNLIENGVTLYDSVDDPTGESVAVDPNAVTTDLGFNKLRRQIPDFADYFFSLEPISEQDKAHMVPSEGKNQFAATIYRPLPGEEAVDVNFNIVLTSRKTNAKASKKFTIKVLPLTEEEIKAEKNLMNKAKWGFVDLIKGENADINAVDKNLATFAEYHWTDQAQGQAQAVDHYKLQIGKGIKPEIYKKVEGGLGDNDYTFWTSNGNVIVPDSLTIRQPQYNTRVDVKTRLTSIRYGKYEEKYPDNELFKGLNKQVVSASALVLGRDGEDPNPNAKISVKFQINGSDLQVGKVTPAHRVWLPEKDVTDVAKGTTALNVIKSEAQKEGYVLNILGNYLKSVKNPSGVLLSEKTNGENSGWMFTINREYPMDPETGIGYTLDQYVLQDGDEILLYYNNDYKKFWGIPPMAKELEDADKGVKVSFAEPIDTTKFGLVVEDAKVDLGQGYSANKAYNIKFVDKYTKQEVSAETVMGKDGDFTVELTKPEGLDWTEESLFLLNKNGEDFLVKEYKFRADKLTFDTAKTGIYVLANKVKEPPVVKEYTRYEPAGTSFKPNFSAELAAKLEWTSENPEIVEVNADKEFLIKKPGSTSVEAELDNHIYRYKIYVAPAASKDLSGYASGSYAYIKYKPVQGEDGIFVYRAIKKDGKYEFKYCKRIEADAANTIDFKCSVGKRGETTAFIVKPYAKINEKTVIGGTSKTLYFQDKIMLAGKSYAGMNPFDKEAKAKSYNTKLVTVGKDGRLSALAAGKTTVKFEGDKADMNYRVYVRPKTPSHFTGERNGKAALLTFKPVKGQDGVAIYRNGKILTYAKGKTVDSAYPSLPEKGVKYFFKLKAYKVIEGERFFSPETREIYFVR